MPVGEEQKPELSKTLSGSSKEEEKDINLLKKQESDKLSESSSQSNSKSAQ